MLRPFVLLCKPSPPVASRQPASIHRVWTIQHRQGLEQAIANSYSSEQSLKGKSLSQ